MRYLVNRIKVGPYYIVVAYGYVRNIFNKVSWWNDNKHGKYTIYTDLWSPPSAVHKLDASAKDITGL